MNIYIAISDFTEVVLLNQLQNPVSAKNLTDIKRNKFSSVPSLIDREDEDFEREKAGKFIKTEKKKDLSYNEAQQCIMNTKDITKSIDSGVYLETKEIEDGNVMKENGHTYSMGKQFKKEKFIPTGRPRLNSVGNGYQSECYLSLNIRQEQKKPLILYFKKGDIFAGLTPEDRGWRGVFALRSSTVGYIPELFLKFLEERSSWLTKKGLKSSREIHMKALSELQTSSALRARPDVVYGTMIPDPDYSDEESETHSRQSSNTTNTTTSSSSPNKMVARNNRVNSNVSNKSPQKENKCSPGDRFDEKGLILPKKLPNPNMESTDKKSLHRELLFNQKLGISVLNQKSELQKALEKHKGKQALKEQEKEKQTLLTPLQRAIDERAQRLEKTAKEEEKEKPESDQSEASNEFQKIQAKFRSKIEAK